ncbi:LytTR family DNA-binding domain-containing protein [Treponema sp.]|uniref:LytTR family DNA-binding domain-containing protein n=1 Tax=Treponema sp. TaxID=166 RepID=UPI003F1074B9
MKITILDKDSDAEDEIIVKCSHLSPDILRLLNSFKAGKDKLFFSTPSEIVVVSPEEIYYFESVDNNVFAYTKDSVYESKSKLYQLENSLLSRDFIRVNKAVVLNINKITRLVPAFGGRFEAVLKNGYKIIISRMYLPLLKEKLGM